MPKRILLVEDEALIALDEAGTIERHGYEVETVYNGERAVESAVSDESISLILMDIDLGRGMDGTEAARRILEERDLPIVFLTSHAEKEYVDRVKQITRYGYILKNSGEFVLIEAINMAFELYHAHRKTRIQERRYRLDTLMSNLPGMAYRCRNDRQWTMEFVSEGCLALTGFEKRELEHNQTAAYGDLISADDKEEVWRKVQAALSGGEYFTVRYRIYTKTGKLRWVWEQGVGIYSGNGSLLHVEGFITDITAEIQAKSDLEKALQEKDSLMREFTHRVKNNMAMVASLIRLKDGETEEDLTDIIRRIDTVQLVHEKLHRKEGLDRIEIREYLQDLLDTIFSSFSEYPVAVENRIEDVLMPSRWAVPIGLIVNELATNAIQHGFSKEEEARFTVSLNSGNNSLSISVSNTGNPFPQGIDIDNSSTFGLQLISNLVAQLNGTLGIKRRPITVFEMQFQESPCSPR